MSKVSKNKQVEEKDPLDEVLKRHELTSEAYDFTFDLKNKEWMKVTIKYNVETNEARIDSIKPFAKTLPIALNNIDELFVEKMTRSRK